MSERQIIARSGWCSLEHERAMLNYAMKAAAVPTSPKVCFLNTASSSTPDYEKAARELIESLGGIADTLDLFGTVRRDMTEFFCSQNVVHVGGGNTKSMLALWRDYGLDLALRQAWEQGVVLTGFSAGAICWFEQGVTNSLEGPLQVISGLGFLSGSACPHYDVEKDRRPAFLQKIKNGEMKQGFALNDFTGLHFKK